ncbi:hypothetical protein AFE_0149 [Acidithiobacillus ferrooxidans ATCC 23270]|uniref:Uncharacterized protein n=1 Tax=Acidithiobacillus ferrooxidans (strain ATCC 23270 / DSM 14882 / CIP 104768 / NCIMB 8455) TaxID=243159 RepID=B7J3P4_ACIF2|nr:hypothetical protein AFE_0149 [Acidithiobacillus ferrooxidans ATCC 23270]
MIASGVGHMGSIWVTGFSLWSRTSHHAFSTAKVGAPISLAQARTVSFKCAPTSREPTPCVSPLRMAGRFILMPRDPRFGAHHHALGLECSALLQKEGGFIVSCHQLEE